VADAFALLPWLDWALLAVLAVSVLVGLIRGFIYEMLSLLGWVAAWFAAQWAAPQLGPVLPVGAPGSAMNLAAAFALVFVGALIVWSLGAKLVRMLVHATPLSAADRVLGASFGFVRGTVLLLGVATVVALTPASRSVAWQTSTGAAWLQIGLHGLKPLLPPQVANRLPVALSSTPAPRPV
jgi:membrane protein required for colicin V production